LVALGFSIGAETVRNERGKGVARSGTDLPLHSDVIVALPSSGSAIRCRASTRANASAIIPGPHRTGAGSSSDRIARAAPGSHQTSDPSLCMWNLGMPSPAFRHIRMRRANCGS